MTAAVTAIRPMARQRLDKAIVDRGLIKSREHAKALVMAGKVTINGILADKPGTPVDDTDAIEVHELDMPFVSRGGLKLAAALDHFGADPQGLVAADIGCSTGGFTDCLLQRGASKVYAIDVGYGQFDWSLRYDPRVVLLEKTNIRHLESGSIADSVDLAVIDVSFISLTLVLPKVYELVISGGHVIALVKPQFEVGRELVERGGIVRKAESRLEALQKIRVFAVSSGFTVLGDFESPVAGVKGNREFFLYLRRV